jgi:hypothetical protein
LLRAASKPPADVLDALKCHKAEIVALLRPGHDGWSAEDWQVFLDERTDIAERNGGLTRPEAEARAFACCMVAWMNRNFVRSPPGRCLVCDCGDHHHDLLLPYGIEPIGYAWLHSRCWPAWHASRKSEAVAALKALGIPPSPEFPDDFGKNGGA